MLDNENKGFGLWRRCTLLPLFADVCCTLIIPAIVSLKGSVRNSVIKALLISSFRRPSIRTHDIAWQTRPIEFNSRQDGSESPPNSSILSLSSGWLFGAVFYACISQAPSVARGFCLECYLRSYGLHIFSRRWIIVFNSSVVVIPLELDRFEQLAAITSLFTFMSYYFYVPCSKTGNHWRTIDCRYDIHYFHCPRTWEIIHLLDFSSSLRLFSHGMVLFMYSSFLIHVDQIEFNLGRPGYTVDAETSDPGSQR